jgi:hypothetical protein
MSVLAMGFALLGHQVHHLRIVEENYYPLLGNISVLSDKTRVIMCETLFSGSINRGML